MTTNVFVLILTFNEEENIAACLRSVVDWAQQVLVVDSGSTDKTKEIVRSMGVEVVSNTFENFSKQRNFALDQIDSSYNGWVLFLDADEYLTPEIRNEIQIAIKSNDFTNYFLNRKFIWQGKWVKRGYYPSRIIRLFKFGFARCEDRIVNEHLVVEGKSGYISADFIHKCRKPISFWVEKHIQRAQMEALELAQPSKNQIQTTLFKNRVETKRWIRIHIWEKLPIFIRPFLLFFYRLFIQGGLLDGRRAFGYHFLQTLWFTMLIDIFYLEIKRNRKSERD